MRKEKIIQGTTPTHTFVTEQIDVESIKSLRITYQQGGRTILEKTENDVVIFNHFIEFTLAQEETLKFRAGYEVSIQIKVLLVDGSVMASPIIPVGIDKILNTEVLE